MQDPILNRVLAQEFFNWQTPQDLLGRSRKYITNVGSERFLSTGGEHEKTVQEALVGSTFASCLSCKTGDMKMRMAEQGAALKDFELELDHSIHEFEVTVAYEPNYKIRRAWRNGQSPKIPVDAFCASPIDPKLLAAVVQKKTQKACKSPRKTKRHLVVYQCIWGGLPDLKDLRSLCDEAASAWASAWIISGVPFAGGVGLLFNDYGFDWPIMEWLSYVDAKQGGGFGGFDIYLQ